MVVHHFLITLNFFIQFVGWNELIHRHLIPHSLLVNTNIRNRIISSNLRNRFMMHHPMLNRVISQTKHSVI